MIKSTSPMAAQGGRHENLLHKCFTLRLPAFFSHGMVIGKTARIWGWGSPGQPVTVVFLGTRYHCVCGQEGRFEVTVAAAGYGGPHSMTIGEHIINDVYVGKVWLCGGQSNMETPISRTRTLLDADIVPDTRIRAFQVEKGVTFDKPARDVTGQWRVAADAALDEMYAVPYFFARQLLTDDDTPIGLLCAPAGGTPIQGWLPEEIIKDFPVYDQALLPVKDPAYVERLTTEGNARVQAWHGELFAKDAGLLAGWQLPGYDDTGWESRMLLDNANLPPHGAVWYRKWVKLPPITGMVTLNLGRVINSVKVYVNGVLVNSVGYMYPPCICELPGELLREGENLIAVQVVGDANKLGFVPGKEYALTYDKTYDKTQGEEQINLNALWKCRVGATMPKIEGGAWFYDRPCGVYNHMLAPLLGYSVDGMLWYQGESNVGSPAMYQTLFTLFAAHIRKHFDGNLPIVFAQLANLADPGSTPGENLALLREQQRQCLNIPNTAMVVTIDCGEWNDIHPRDKKTVGERLALCARRLAYGQDVADSGPVPTGAACEGGLLQVSFNHGTGLWAKGGFPIVDVVDGADCIHRFYAAPLGEKLVVKVGHIKPKAIRFGWADSPAVPLYNAYNLPASPFVMPVL